VLWQITIPVLTGAVILLVLSLLATTLEAGEASRWSSITIIWLAIPAMLLALISFVFLAASVYATVRLIQVLPYYSYRLLGWLLLLGINIQRQTNRMVEPIIRAHSLSASVRAAGRQARRR
jgi:hypothetical protein